MVVAAACGSDPEDSADDGVSVTAEDGVEVGSLDDCPDPLVIQTDWFPRPEHGALYNLTAGAGSMDPATGRFTGPLAAEPSIELEIRSGGPFLGQGATVRHLSSDRRIFLALMDTDEAIVNYERFPTTAVLAPLEVNPQMLMYDPETYDIESWDDVLGTEATISHSSGSFYTRYLADSGLVDEDQLERSYDGSPDRFVRSGGQIFQEGSASLEPFNYQFVFTEWGEPPAYLLIHDSGYETYKGALTILDSALDDDARSCLTAFVPLVQQSMVDFQQDPAVTSGVILEAANRLNGSWRLTGQSVTNSVIQMGALGVVGNGLDKTVGNFDLDRLEEVLTILEEQVPSVEVPEGMVPDDLVTNDFIDSGIGL